MNVAKCPECGLPVFKCTCFDEEDDDIDDDIHEDDVLTKFDKMINNQEKNWQDFNKERQTKQDLED